MHRLLTLCVLLAALPACKKEEEPPAPTDTAPITVPDPTQVIPLGSPAWVVSDIALFTGPAGDGTQTCLLNGPHVWDGNVWSPGEAHQPPYGSEISDKLAGCGLTAKTEFTSADLLDANGIWLGLILEAGPGAAPGSSPDYPMGSVINFDRFPIVIDADVRKEGKIVDLDNDFSYPGPDTWGFVVTGLSHVPLLFKTTNERMPAGAAPEGNFQWDVALRDATSIVSESGYDLVVPFTVVP